MTQQQAIQLFGEKKVRTVWDEEQEKWYFSIVDVVAVLTDSPNPRKYWSVLKTRLRQEGSELTTNCSQLKMRAADGKMYFTDVADTEQLFRLIQSIPSPKAEPFKLWLAQVARERLDQIQDPELSIEQAMKDYKRLGYSDNWINQRLKSIEIRKELTDEWKKRGLQEGVQFASLTDIIYKTWAGKTIGQCETELKEKIADTLSPKKEYEQTACSLKATMLKRLCHTKLGYDRINRKLGLRLSPQEIEDFVSGIIGRTDEAHFRKRGKNYYITNDAEGIRITVNSFTYTVITADRIYKQ